MVQAEDRAGQRGNDMLLLCSQTYFKISILPDASWAALSMSVPKSTYNYFRECFRKLKMDGNKMPREPRALKSCFATLLICRAGTVLSWAGHGHTRAVQAGEVCGCHAPATPFTLAPKLRHSQLGGDARHLCFLMPGPPQTQSMQKHRSWLQENYGAGGSYPM